MLVNHPDAGVDGIQRRVEAFFLAVDQNLAFVGLVQAVQLAHQRRFSGAVLAQQGMHLARAHVKVDVVVCQHAREALDDSQHLHLFDDGLSGR